MTREICIEDLPRECIEDCSIPGQSADAAADHWRNDPAVAKVLDALDPEDMRQCLRGYGAWDASQLSDDEMNRQRILWLACSSFREYISECEDAGVDPFGERPDDFEPACGSDLFSIE